MAVFLPSAFSRFPRRPSSARVLIITLFKIPGILPEHLILLEDLVLLDSEKIRGQLTFCSSLPRAATPTNAFSTL